MSDFHSPEYQRVTRARPCVVCGKDHWCRYAVGGTLAICNRVPSGRPARGDGGGWLHTVGETIQPAAPVPAVVETPKRSPVEWELIDRQCRADLSPDRLNRLANRLAVSAESLRRLGIGWQVELTVYTFPMRDIDGRITGLRTRHPDGGKRCVAGSRLGLFVPATITNDNNLAAPPDVLIITEGESDAAAALDLGLAAIARPGCASCGLLAGCYVDRLRPGRVVIVADADEPGQRGAEALARCVAGYGVACRVLTPPDGAKDLREWKSRSGCDCHALLALIESPADRTEVLP